VLASLPAPKTTPGTGGSCRTTRIPCCSHHLHRVPRRRRFQQRCGHRSHVWTFCAVKRPTGAYPEVRAEVPCRNPGDLRSEERSGKDALNSRVKARTPVGRSTSCGRFRPARTPTSAHCAAVGRRRLPAGSSAPVTRAGGMRPPEGECSRQSEGSSLRDKLPHPCGSPPGPHSHGSAPWVHGRERSGRLSGFHGRRRPEGVPSRSLKRERGGSPSGSRAPHPYGKGGPRPPPLFPADARACSNRLNALVKVREGPGRSLSTLRILHRAALRVKPLFLGDTQVGTGPVANSLPWKLSGLRVPEPGRSTLV